MKSMVVKKSNFKFLLIPNKVLDYDLNQLEKIKKSLKIFDIQSSIYIQEYSEENLKTFLLHEKNMSEKFVNRYIQNFNKVTRKFRVNTVKNYFK